MFVKTIYQNVLDIVAIVDFILGHEQPSPDQMIAGDFNLDCVINVLDVVVLVNIVLGMSEPVNVGDLNGDGMLNILDVVALVNMIMGAY